MNYPIYIHAGISKSTYDKIIKIAGDNDESIGKVLNRAFKGKYLIMPIPTTKDRPVFSDIQEVH